MSKIFIFLCKNNIHLFLLTLHFHIVLVCICSVFIESLILCIIIVHVNPDNVVIDDGLGHDVVRDLALVQNIITLNIVCGVAMGCLLVSWILDILCQNESDNGGDYHSAWKEILKMFGMQKLTQINLIKT